MGVAASAEEPDVLVQGIVGGELAGAGGEVVAQAVALASATDALGHFGEAGREAAHAAAEGNGSTSVSAILLHDNVHGVRSLRHY